MQRDLLELLSLFNQGYVPDCLNITATVTEHAQMFNQAGLDYVVVGAAL